MYKKSSINFIPPVFFVRENGVHFLHPLLKNKSKPDNLTTHACVHYDTTQSPRDVTIILFYTPENMHTKINNN
jgi:hypothetical protein